VHRFVRRAATALAVAILAAAVVGGPVAAASARAALSGSIPAWANSGNWKQASDPNGPSASVSTSAGVTRPAPKRWPVPSRTRAARPTAST
jgi:hypothetical protein